jgi:hypothetical protein
MGRVEKMDCRANGEIVFRAVRAIEPDSVEYLADGKFKDGLWKKKWVTLSSYSAHEHPIGSTPGRMQPLKRYTKPLKRSSIGRLIPGRRNAAFPHVQSGPDYFLASFILFS